MRATLAIACVSLVAAAGGGAAIEPPLASGDARLGTLHVASGIIVYASSVDLRGVWIDPSLPCSASRRLTVRATVFRTPFGGTGTYRLRTGVFPDANCAEGGPNVGFTLTARRLGYGCPSGRWKPGRYSFVVRTTEPVH